MMYIALTIIGVGVLLAVWWLAAEIPPWQIAWRTGSVDAGTVQAIAHVVER